MANEAALNVRTLMLGEGEALDAARLERRGALPPEVEARAAEIVLDVRERGEEALRAWTVELDGWAPARFRVGDAALDAALAAIDPRLREALEKAARQIRAFHEHEREESWYLETDAGVTLGIKVDPLSSCGIYVPGGRANYPSTVLMNAVPAKVAGVARVVMATPPQRNGTLSAPTLAAAKIAGVDEVYAMGGAQAIAALAYGCEGIEKVDAITGPGNAYVAAAKKFVSGDVGTDLIAGPSEVCVLQDASVDADPLVIAADLAAQAEHDPLAACYLVVFDGSGHGASARLVEDVRGALCRILAESPRADVTRASLEHHGLFVACASEEAAVASVNVIAPEHLEIHTEDPWETLGGVHAAGAVFLGPWSSEPLGDYVAGPNHTLPTGGTARFAGPLSVKNFQVESSVISYGEAGIRADAPATQLLSHAEGLWAHGLSAGLRRMRAEGATPDAYPNLTAIAWPDALADAPGISLDEA